MPGTIAGFANRCTYLAEREEATAESEVPLGRQGGFDPQPIATYQRQFPRFYDNIVSTYARGMRIQKIAGQLREHEGRRSRRARRAWQGITYRPIHKRFIGRNATARLAGIETEPVVVLDHKNDPER